jgi:2C-methyl-D-erythritol 2,4-cyclodiphosphate synthase
MKKIILMTVCALCVHAQVFAFDTRLLNARNKIFEQAKELQALLSSTEDPVAVVSLWDTCIMTATQLNAYFYLVGMYESVSEPTADSVTYLKSWLQEVRRTAQLNIRNLSSTVSITQPATREHLSRVKASLAELSLLLERELDKVARLEKAAQSRPQKAPAAAEQKG